MSDTSRAAGVAGPRGLARWIVPLLILFFASGAAIALLDHLRADGGVAASEVAALTDATGVAAFEQAVVERSRIVARSTLPWPENVTIWPLRSQMFVDSVLLEPAYGGLLVLCLLALRRARPRAAPGRDWLQDVGCLLVASAVMFDIAENGMTVRAAEDALRHLLAQGTMDDVHLATRLKWGFVGAASAVLGVVGLCHRGPERSRWLRVGSVAALLVAPLAATQCAADVLPDGARAPLGVVLVVVFASALAAISLALRREARGGP